MLGLPSGSPQIFRKTYPQIFRNHHQTTAVVFLGSPDVRQTTDVIRSPSLDRGLK
jgi:hypothetical protein